MARKIVWKCILLHIYFIQFIRNTTLIIQVGNYVIVDVIFWVLCASKDETVFAKEIILDNFVRLKKETVSTKFLGNTSRWNDLVEDRCCWLTDRHMAGYGGRKLMTRYTVNVIEQLAVVQKWISGTQTCVRAMADTLNINSSPAYRPAG